PRVACTRYRVISDADILGPEDRYAPKLDVRYRVPLDLNFARGGHDNPADVVHRRVPFDPDPRRLRHGDASVGLVRGHEIAHPVLRCADDEDTLHEFADRAVLDRHAVITGDVIDTCSVPVLPRAINGVAVQV